MRQASPLWTRKQPIRCFDRPIDSLGGLCQRNSIRIELFPQQEGNPTRLIRTRGNRQHTTPPVSQTVPNLMTNPRPMASVA